MASVKISELNTLSSITSDDFIPIVDSGSYTTYRVSFNVLNDWMTTYGSASHAENADFAHTATSASYALSSSWASSVVTASYALTASYYDTSGYAPTNATSASHAATASVLQGNGTSWEQNMQISHSLKISASAWLEIPRKRNFSNVDRLDTIWFHSEYGYDVGSNDYVRLYFAEEVLDSGRLVFEHGDNVDQLTSEGPDIDYQGRNNPGFLWQTLASGVSGSLMFLQTNGKLYLRSAEARDFSASFEVNKVGFYGTASQAITSSYLLGGLPSATQMPWMVENLAIYPYWDTYDGVLNVGKVSVKARSVVVHSSGGDTAQIFNVSQIVDRTVSDAPGGLLGSLTSNHWYDVYVIYNSGGAVQSTVMKDSGTSPDTTDFATDIYPALTLAGYPEYDYGHKVGSVKDYNSTTWVSWIEYGPKTQFAYRWLHPTGAGVPAGFTLTHYLGGYPRDIRIVNKVRAMDTFMTNAGFSLGEEIPAWCFINDTDSNTIEHQPYIVIGSSTDIKIGWGLQGHGFEAHDYNGEYINFIDGPEGPSYFHMIVYATM